jgi:hypothetical protein
MAFFSNAGRIARKLSMLGRFVLRSIALICDTLNLVSAVSFLSLRS